MKEGKHLLAYAPGLVGILMVAVIILFSLPARAVTLETCILTALDNNPDIQAGLTRVKAAKYMIKQAESAYYPRLYLSGTYSMTNNPTQSFMMALNQKDLDMTDPDFDPNDPDQTDNMRMSVGLKYRFYNGGINGINVQMAKAGQHVREYGLQAVQNEMVHQVTRGYYAVLRAQSFVIVQKESLASLEESLRVANVRFHAGSAVKTDVLNLEVKLAQAREDYIRAKNGVQLAIVSLNTAIGSQLVLSDGLPVPVRKENWERPDALDFNLIESRAEMKVRNTLWRIKEQAYEKVSREYRPTVSAFGSYDFDSGNFEDFENSYLMGVMAQWEFFDGFQRPNKRHAAKAEWQVAEKELLKARNALRLDLHQAYLKAMDAWERLEVSEKSVRSADEALRITAELYKEGVAEITTLLTAQVGLTTQKTRSVAAYYDYLTALSNYDRARGLALERYTK
jgi:outer membrane protein